MNKKFFLLLLLLAQTTNMFAPTRKLIPRERPGGTAAIKQEKPEETLPTQESEEPTASAQPQPPAIQDKPQVQEPGQPPAQPEIQEPTPAAKEPTTPQTPKPQEPTEEEKQATEPQVQEEPGEEAAAAEEPMSEKEFEAARATIVNTLATMKNRQEKLGDHDKGIIAQIEKTNRKLGLAEAKLLESTYKTVISQLEEELKTSQNLKDLKRRTIQLSKTQKAEFDKVPKPSIFRRKPKSYTETMLAELTTISKKNAAELQKMIAAEAQQIKKEVAAFKEEAKLQIAEAHRLKAERGPLENLRTLVLQAHNALNAAKPRILSLRGGIEFKPGSAWESLTITKDLNTFISSVKSLFPFLQTRPKDLENRAIELSKHEEILSKFSIQLNEREKTLKENHEALGKEITELEKKLTGFDAQIKAVKTNEEKEELLRERGKTFVQKEAIAESGKHIIEALNKLTKPFSEKTWLWQEDPFSGKSIQQLRIDLEYAKKDAFKTKIALLINAGEQSRQEIGEKIEQAYSIIANLKPRIDTEGQAFLNATISNLTRIKTQLTTSETEIANITKLLSEAVTKPSAAEKSPAEEKSPSYTKLINDSMQRLSEHEPKVKKAKDDIDTFINDINKRIEAKYLGLQFPITEVEKEQIETLEPLLQKFPLEHEKVITSLTTILLKLKNVSDITKEVQKGRIKQSLTQLLTRLSNIDNDQYIGLQTAQTNQIKALIAQIKTKISQLMPRQQELLSLLRELTGYDELTLEAAKDLEAPKPGQPADPQVSFLNALVQLTKEDDASKKRNLLTALEDILISGRVAYSLEENTFRAQITSAAKKIFTLEKNVTFLSQIKEDLFKQIKNQLNVNNKGEELVFLDKLETNLDELYKATLDFLPKYKDLLNTLIPKRNLFQNLLNLNPLYEIPGSTNLKEIQNTVINERPTLSSLFDILIKLPSKAESYAEITKFHKIMKLEEIKDLYKTLKDTNYADLADVQTLNVQALIPDTNRLLSSLRNFKTSITKLNTKEDELTTLLSNKIKSSPQTGSKTATSKEKLIEELKWFLRNDPPKGLVFLLRHNKDLQQDIQLKEWLRHLRETEIEQALPLQQIYLVQLKKIYSKISPPTKCISEYEQELKKNFEAASLDIKNRTSEVERLRTRSAMAGQKQSVSYVGQSIPLTGEEEGILTSDNLLNLCAYESRLKGLIDLLEKIQAAGEEKEPEKPLTYIKSVEGGTETPAKEFKPSPPIKGEVKHVTPTPPPGQQTTTTPTPPQHAWEESYLNVTSATKIEDDKSENLKLNKNNEVLINPTIAYYKKLLTNKYTVSQSYAHLKYPEKSLTVNLTKADNKQEQITNVKQIIILTTNTKKIPTQFLIIIKNEFSFKKLIKQVDIKGESEYSPIFYPKIVVITTQKDEIEKSFPDLPLSVKLKSSSEVKITPKKGTSKNYPSLAGKILTTKDGSFTSHPERVIILVDQNVMDTILTENLPVGQTTSPKPELSLPPIPTSSTFPAVIPSKQETPVTQISPQPRKKPTKALPSVPTLAPAPKVSAQTQPLLAPPAPVTPIVPAKIVSPEPTEPQAEKIYDNVISVKTKNPAYGELVSNPNNSVLVNPFATFYKKYISGSILQGIYTHPNYPQQTLVVTIITKEKAQEDIQNVKKIINLITTKEKPNETRQLLIIIKKEDQVSLKDIVQVDIEDADPLAETPIEKPDNVIITTNEVSFNQSQGTEIQFETIEHRATITIALKQGKTLTLNNIKRIKILKKDTNPPKQSPTLVTILAAPKEMEKALLEVQFPYNFINVSGLSQTGFRGNPSAYFALFHALYFSTAKPETENLLTLQQHFTKQFFYKWQRIIAKKRLSQIKLLQLISSDLLASDEVLHLMTQINNFSENGKIKPNCMVLKYDSLVKARESADPISKLKPEFTENFYAINNNENPLPANILRFRQERTPQVIIYLTNKLYVAVIIEKGEDDTITFKVINSTKSGVKQEHLDELYRYFVQLPVKRSCEANFFNQNTKVTIQSESEPPQIYENVQNVIIYPTPQYLNELYIKYPKITKRLKAKPQIMIKPEGNATATNYPGYFSFFPNTNPTLIIITKE